ncbi:MAG: ribosome maturation factor RimM [Oscillospiraceae bacterium]
MKLYLEAGEFVTTHGVMGELKLYPWSDDAAFLTRFTRFYFSATGDKAAEVQRIRTHKNMCIVQLEGVNSIETARPYIGKTVFIDRREANLQEGQVFVQDLIGARVQDATTGQVYGTIATITHPGKHDVYEIHGDKDEVYLFPAVKEFLEKIDADTGLVLVRPIAGMFGEATE